MRAERALHLVDADTGEVVHDHRDDVIAGLQRDIRGWAHRYAELKRDKEREAREHQLWPAAVQVVKAWRVACNHPRSSFGHVEFELIRPFLQDKQYGQSLEERQTMCLRAVAGASFDAFTTRRKNGSLKRHDSLDLIFRCRSKFEEMVNRAPSNWRELLPDSAALQGKVEGQVGAAPHERPAPGTTAQPKASR